MTDDAHTAGLIRWYVAFQRENGGNFKWFQLDDRGELYYTCKGAMYETRIAAVDMLAAIEKMKSIERVVPSLAGKPTQQAQTGVTEDAKRFYLGRISDLKEACPRLHKLGYTRIASTHLTEINEYRQMLGLSPVASWDDA